MKCIARALVVCRLLLAGAVVMFGAGPAFGQDLSLADRGPRFMYQAASTAAPVEVDAHSNAALRSAVTLELERPTVGAVIEAIERQVGLKFAFSREVLPPNRPVNLRAERITVGAALMEILMDTGVDVVLMPGRQVALVTRAARRAAIQPGAIVGRVTDGKTAQGLPGAEVSLEKAHWRATTGEGGQYRLVDVEPGSYTLTVRRIGYAKRTVPVTVTSGQEQAVDIALQPVPTQLDEVVTTVTGEQRRLELGHAISTINADSLVKEAPVSNLTQLLNGRVPGLRVSTSQGTVGGDAHLQVRGANSISLSTEPIVIVDGIRYTSQEGRSFIPTPLFTSEGTSRLNDLNPNDIQTIEVVKGPSAATLYGTDASNGVVVITTKRGQPGPARWNAYAKGTSTGIPTAHFADSYWGWGTAKSSCTLAKLAAHTCVQDSITVIPNPLNDPTLTIFSARPSWVYGANVSGGRPGFRYYFSGDFERATGPVRMPPGIADSVARQRGVSELPSELLDPNTLTKGDLRSNITANLGEKFELQVNAGYSRSATRTMRVAINPYDGSIAATPTSPYTGTSTPTLVFAQTSTERTDRFVGTASAQWRPVSWLQTRATAGLDLAVSNRASLLPQGQYPSLAFYNNGSVGDDRARRASATAEVGATASAQRGRLSLRTSIGAQYVRNLTDVLATGGFGLPPGASTVASAATTFVQQYYGETVTLGSYLEEVVGLNQRLYVTGALRVDGASAFGRDYAATAYPKASVSWLLSDEPFMPRLPGLDELRLRYAFGASGQQALPSMSLPRYLGDPAIVDGAAAPAVHLSALGNPDLRPERVREHEFGFDASVLKRRVELGLTWYRRRTLDQIVQHTLPPGLGSIYTNLGLTTGRGFEAQLTARVLDTRAISWDLVAQHSWHTTELVELGGAVAQYSGNGGYVVGYPLGVRFVRPLLGYQDANGDGIITNREVQMGDSAVYAGESVPPRSQTLSSVIGFFQRKLRLSALLERRSGFTQVNSLRASQCLQARCQAAVDPSTPLAEQAQAAAVGTTGAPGQPFTNFRFVEPGDFTRLREVTAALDLPASAARLLHVRSATLSVAARNLALWTDFTGPDPESAFVNGLAGGFANGIPQGRSWTIRLDLGL